MFDMRLWTDGYARGYGEGHDAGECMGEQALRDRLLRLLETWGQDLRLGLLDVKSPDECLHHVMLLIEERRHVGNVAVESLGL